VWGRGGGEELVSKTEHEKVSRMIRVIYEKGSINRWDMIDEVKVSIRDYYNLKAYMEHKYQYAVKYDETTECWILLVEKKELK